MADQSDVEQALVDLISIALYPRGIAGLSGKMFGGDERMPDESGETGYLLVVETQEESRACATRIAFSAS